MGQLVQAKGGAVAIKVDEAPSQYLTFALGGEMFAVGILNVKEIIEYGMQTIFVTDLQDILGKTFKLFHILYFLIVLTVKF